jgi:hypothetical protein
MTGQETDAMFNALAYTALVTGRGAPIPSPAA